MLISVHPNKLWKFIKNNRRPISTSRVECHADTTSCSILCK